MVKYLSFQHSSFALRYFFNVKMARPQCDTPPSCCLPRHLWIGFCCLLVVVVGGCQNLFWMWKTLAHYKQTTTTKSYKLDIDLYKGEILMGGGDGGAKQPHESLTCLQIMLFSPTVYKSNQHIKTNPHINYLLIYLPTRVNPGVSRARAWF